MRSRDSRGFRICISVYLNGLYLLCRLLLKHELGLTLKIFRFSNKNFPDHQRRTPPQLVLTRISNFLTRKLTKLKNLRILQFRFSYNFKSSDWFFSFSFSLSKKRKILAEVKMKKLDVNHGGTSSDAFFLKSRSLCPVSLALG